MKLIILHTFRKYTIKENFLIQNFQKHFTLYAHIQICWYSSDTCTCTVYFESNLHLLNNTCELILRGPNQWGPTSLILHVDGMPGQTTRIQDVPASCKVSTLGSQMEARHSILSLMKKVSKYTNKSSYNQCILHKIMMFVY